MSLKDYLKSDTEPIDYVPIHKKTNKLSQVKGHTMLTHDMRPKIRYIVLRFTANEDKCP